MSAFHPFRTLAAYVCLRPTADIRRGVWYGCSIIGKALLAGIDD